MIRVLAVSPIPEEGAGCRFRIAQYIPYLREHGFEVTLVSLFTTDFFRKVYRRGNLLQKAITFAGLSARHLWALREVNQYDVIFLYREIFPIGPAIVESLLSMPGCPPIVMDFDDAIFLPNTSEANRLIAALKSPTKVATTVRRSAHITVGNAYLADYARRYNDAVTVIPTCVDTDVFAPAPPSHAPGRRPVVGWIGSPTTADYLRTLSTVFQQVHQRHPFTLRVSGAGEPVTMPGIDIDNVAWSLSGEVALFQSCDIGVYPLTDDEWSKGKCGFKAIEFMACGVPVVASAVGVNREIIEDGVNGFLCRTERDWTDKLGRLIEDAQLRVRLAAAGRETIKQRYSLQVNAPKLADVLQQVSAGGRRKS